MLMKRVLFLVNHDIVIYNFRLELVERLLADGHEVWISSPYGARIDDLKELGCGYVEADISRHGMNPIAELKLRKYYKRIISRIKPDMVFSYTVKPNIYGAMACRCLHVPCVANITGLGTAVENGGLSQRLLVLLYKAAFSGIQRVFFQNEENRQFFINKRIALGKHGMLPGSGVNLTRYAPIEYPDDRTVEFAFIARIMREKAIDNYLEAARAIREKHPNTVFHICGFCEAEYNGKLQQYIDDGSVIYHGLLRDIKPILKQSHAVILPSYYEGMSNTLLEAAAVGRPLIASNVSGCKEAFDEGISGYGFEAKDTASLINSIEKFLSLSYMEKKRMGLAGCTKMEKEFDRNIVIEAYIKELYIHVEKD